MKHTATLPAQSLAALAVAPRRRCDAALRLGQSWSWLLLAAMVAAPWPVWRWYVARLSDGSDEPFGLVALLAEWFITKLEHRLLRWRPPQLAGPDL